MEDAWGRCIPTDAVVEILRRLPTSSRRRLRLVCKRWRDLINERTPELQVRTKILAFLSQDDRSHAVVFDDKDGHRRHAWTYPCCGDGCHVNLVGTCNGLLCLHESCGLSFSTITVINPISGEKRELPPVPTTSSWARFGTYGKYSFGYHPVTGQYKVVHIPRAPRQAVDAVQVFTLGDTSWRTVPVSALGSSYDCSSGAISVDGSTYWLSAFTDRVMALDLDNESVTSFPVPPQAKRPVSAYPGELRWQLTNIHGKLGLVVTDLTMQVKEVWVLEEDTGEQPRWSKRYNLPVQTARSPGRWIVAPHLIHGGEYILSQSWDRIQHSGRCYAYGRTRLFRHKVDSENKLLLNAAELTMSAEEGAGELATFEYVEETLDQLP